LKWEDLMLRPWDYGINPWLHNFIRVLIMGFARAMFRLEGELGAAEGLALVDSGAWYTVIDEGLARMLGVKYTGLRIVLTSFSGYRVVCREAMISSIILEGKKAPSELLGVCGIPEPVSGWLRRQDVDDRLVVGLHTLERLGYAVDVVAHRVIESPGILMI
jgi:predicted aspartyl protease